MNFSPVVGNNRMSSIRNMLSCAPAPPTVADYDDEPRSSLSRMLTKLYGGQGPVYLNFRRFPYLRAILLTTLSNSVSRLRSTRKAAFMIILSPIGWLSREATQQLRSAS